MMRGFLGGAILGLLFAATGLAVLSLKLEPAAMKPKLDAMSEAPEMPVAEEPTTDTGADEEVSENEMDEAVVDEQAPEVAEAPQPIDTAPTDTPPASDDQVKPAKPAEGGTEPEVLDQPEEPETARIEEEPRIKSDPVAPIGNLAPNVETSRLPSIGAEADGEAPEEPLALALDRNAAPYSNADGRPLMAVVLRDVGAARSGLGDLKNLPFAISFIVDAAAPDAAQAIEFYINAGSEVVVEPVLPAGAAPSDVEVNFQAQSDLIDQSVAVFMPSDSSFQSDAPLARQVSEILVLSGHGIVSEPAGLNTGHKTAIKAGIAAKLVFRTLDGEAQDARVQQRFLDNAAFKAGQEDGVILVGTANDVTIQALIEWSLGNRIKSVAMAPVSALLQEK